jgi:acetoin utilization protein AcuC
MAQGKSALLFARELSDCSFGTSHPFRPDRYRLAYELMEAYGLTVDPFVVIRDFPSVAEGELCTFHYPDYLACLREFSGAAHPRADFRYGLGDAENPVFPGMYDWAVQGVAATAEAARLVLDEGYGRVFHLGGGWHHGHRGKASGFSYLNDVVIAINRLVARGKRVAYLDIDAHHGDGVQEAFYDTDRVVTISLHQSGIYFFPGTGFEHETGVGPGTGFSVNVPFLEHADDEIFMRAFDEIAVPRISAFAPDVLVTQLGADTFRSDPLTLLEVTTRGYAHVVQRLAAFDLPWIGVAGGGYDSANVIRAWTLAWAAMNQVELSPELPATYAQGASLGGRLHDPPHRSEEGTRCRAAAALERSLALLRKTGFPSSAGRVP